MGELVRQFGYWAESVTPLALEHLVAYVCGWQAHHGDLSLVEPWEANLHGSRSADPKGGLASQLVPRDLARGKGVPSGSGSHHRSLDTS